MLEKLKEIRQYLSDPDHWTKNAWARTKDNIVIGTWDERAVKFCLVGCISRFEQDSHKRMKIYKQLEKEGVILQVINDSLGYNSVLQLLDKHINELELEGGYA